VLVLGLAYKNDVDDDRESPSVELLELLKAKGAKIAYSDPHIPKFRPMRKHNFNLKSVKLTAKSLASFDCVLLATAHKAFDYALIKKHAKLIVDTRGKYRRPSSKIVRA